MNAYLKDFKKRMMESRSDETMGIEEAAWYLSSVANYDFGNAYVEYDDIRFDTLYGHVNLTDGKATLQDLGEAYSDIARSIDAFYNSLQIDGKHFRFIDVTIGEDGTVTIPLITTFTSTSRYLGDTMYYFSNGSSYHFDTLAYHYFGDTIYYANSTAIYALNRELNKEESRPTSPLLGERVYYTITRIKYFHYTDYQDPCGSPYYHNSRLYSGDGITASPIYPNDMLYLFDSYLGLGFEYLLLDEEIVNWEVIFDYKHEEGPVNHYHELKVGYGHPTESWNPIDY